MIMYPALEGSPLNHRRGYCAEGVKQSSKVKELLPWPQPHRICSDGHTFHPTALLDTPKDLLERSIMQLPHTLTTMGDKAFAALIKSCLIRTNDGHFLFCFFQEFAVDPSTPNPYFHIHDSVNYPSLSRRRAGDVRSQVSKLPSSLLCLAVYFSVALATIHLLNFIPRGYC